MFLFGNKRNRSQLKRVVSGLEFSNPLGSKSWSISSSFIVTTPPKENVIDWVSAIKTKYPSQVVALDISEDIQRNFSLAYDFADFLIINPDHDGGINAMDISDIVNLLDSLLSLRLCYEKYTPVYLRISNSVTSDELNTLLSYCRLSGIDGIVAEGLHNVQSIRDLSQNRMPIIGATHDASEAISMLSEGASLVELDTNALVLKRTLKTLEKQ